jgi:putative transposase
MLERLNEEIKRRTHVVRIFPNGESCLRLVRALAVETHENCLEQHRYLNMEDLHEHQKEALWPASPRSCDRSTSGRAPKWLMISAARKLPISPQTGSGRARVKP